MSGFALAPQTGCMSAGRSGDLRPGVEVIGHYIDGVPFVEQDQDRCGPAAVAGLLSFWGRPRPVAEISAHIFLPELRGTLPIDMERYVRAAGLSVESLNGTGTDIRNSVLLDRPVVALLDLGIGPYRRPHYVTVIGFDDAAGQFIVHDGRTPNRMIAYGRFAQAWRRGGSWMLLAVPGPTGRPQ